MKSYLSTSCAAALLGLSVFTPPLAYAQGVSLFAVLAGGNEVSGGGAANAGDQNGFGTATIIVHPTSDPNNEQLCFGITVRGIDRPTAAHIHFAKAGVNGPISLALTAPAVGNPGTSSGCKIASNALVNALTSRPANFYVNVHTVTFPGGALRGQLF
jgi:CHRD domain